MYIKIWSICLVTLVEIFFSSTSVAKAQQDIVVEVVSMSNIAGNGAIEACGTATHIKGYKPLLVTIKHDESYYSTLTSPNNAWCVVFKRWLFSGEIDVNATTLDFSTKSAPKSFSLGTNSRR